LLLIALLKNSSHFPVTKVYRLIFSKTNKIFNEKINAGIRIQTKIKFATRKDKCRSKDTDIFFNDHL